VKRINPESGRLLKDPHGTGTMPKAGLQPTAGKEGFKI